MIDRAMNIRDQSKNLPPEQQFAWTGPGWVMSKVLDDWDGQTPARRQRLDDYVKAGRLQFHALPFTLESAADMNDAWLTARRWSISPHRFREWLPGFYQYPKTEGRRSPAVEPPRMKTKNLVGLVAVGLGLTLASSARAGWGVSVSIGLPVFCPPPVVCAPAPPVVYAPAPVYLPPPVVVAPPYAVYPAYRPVVMAPPPYGWHGHGHRYGYRPGWRPHR